MLEDLEKKLYKGKSEKDQEGDFLINLQKKKKILEESSEALEKPLDWKRADEINLKSGFWSNFLLKFGGFGVKIFWLLIVVMAGLTLFVGFYIYQYFSVSREITFSLSAPENAMLGVPFDLTVNFNNNSKNILSNAAVSVFLPEGAMVLGGDLNKRVITKEINKLEANAGFNEKIPIII